MTFGLCTFFVPKNNFKLHFIFSVCKLINFNANHFYLTLLTLKKLFISFLIFAFLPAWSQNVLLKNFNEEDGLPSSKIVCLYQDSKGYLWIGTTDGLSRYDGLSFTNYKIFEGNLSNFIYKILEDKYGHIWFQTYDGLTRFDGENFKKLTASEGFYGNEITDFEVDNSGQIWIVSEQGISRFDGNKCINYKPKGTSKFIRQILVDRKGKLWFADKQEGLLHFNGKEFVNVSTKHGRSDGISKIFEDEDGNIWFIADAGKQISYYKGDVFIDVPLPSKDSEFYEIGEDEEGHMWFSSNQGVFLYNGLIWENFKKVKDAEIKSFLKDKQGNFWLATSNSFVYKYKEGSFEKIDERSGLITNYENSIFEDREGNIWIGTYGFGLYRYSYTDYSFENAKLGINSEKINCMMQDSQGQIWYGTSSKGVYRYDGKTVQNYSTDQGLGSNIVNSIFEDKQGDIWFSCVGGLQSKPAPLSKFDGKSFSNFYHKGGFETQFKFAMAQSSDSNLLIGTFKGLFQFNMNDKSFSKMQQVGNDYIKCIVKDQNENLWVGTFGGGLAKYDKGGQRFYNTKSGLSSNFVNCLLFDTLGNLWVGTDKGINVLRFNEDNDIRSVDLINNKHALNNEIITSLCLDDAQNLWIGTFGGVNKLNLKEYFKAGSKLVKSYGFEDGLKGVKCLDNSILKDSNGNVWFGTSKGLLKWSSENSSKKVEPNVYIKNLRLFYEDVDFTTFGAKYEPESNLPIDLKLPYNKNYLTFDFLAICLTNQKLVKYQYKLKGFDAEWLPVTQENFATYSNLPSGDYKFMVLASDASGIWNTRPATFSFSVYPPIWRSIWFYFLVVLFVAGCIFAFIYFRVKFLRKKEEQKTSLNQELAKMELKALRAQMNPHFIFNSLNSIQLYISRNDKELANKFLSSFSKLIRLTLENSGKSSVALVEELSQLRLYLELERLRLGNKLGFEIIVEDSVNIYELEIPTLLIQPFVENAIWHGVANKDSDGKVEITIKKENDFLVIWVSDNGIGREQARKIRNQKEFQNKSKGILVTNERLQLLNSLNRQNASINIIDLYDAENLAAGTKVEIFVSMEYLKYD